jgi:hypothetical protein
MNNLLYGITKRTKSENCIGVSMSQNKDLYIARLPDTGCNSSIRATVFNPKLLNDYISI